MAMISSSRRPLSLFLLRHLSTTAPATSDAAATGHAFDPSIRRLARSRDFAAISTAISSSSLPPSSAITNYVSSNMLGHALSLLSSSPSLPLLNSLLSACNHHPKLFLQVPSLFSSLTTAHSLLPDSHSFSILIKSLCRARRTHDALETLAQKHSKNLNPNIITYTTILDSLYKENKPDRAESLWNDMISKGITPDAPAYNVRIMHQSLTGKPADVLALISEMEDKGLKADTITFNYLIVSNVKDGKFDVAKKVYDEMGEKGCEPSYATYRTFLSALCKKGKVEMAVGVFEDSLKRKRVPDLGTVKMLVAGLVKRKKERAAKRVVTGLRHKFAEDFVGGWKELEKMVGLDKEGEEDGTVVVPA